MADNRGQKLNKRLQNIDTDQGPNSVEQMTDPYVQGGRSLYTGLAQLTGLPGTIESGVRSVIGAEGDTYLPTGQEIQQAAADYGVAHEPGEEPEDILNRTLENIGAGLIPGAGLAARGVKTGARLAPMLYNELAAAGGGAAGGKALQETDWGQENPQLARAAGELLGGVGGASPQVGGRIAKGVGDVLSPTKMITEGPPLLRLAKRNMRGEKAYKRAVKSMMNQAENPEEAERILRQAMDNPEEFIETAAQKTGDPGIMRLRKQIEHEVPEEAQYGTQQISEATEELKKMSVPSEEGAGEFQSTLNDILQRRGQEAKEALQKARQAQNPEYYSRQARQSVETAFDELRKEENKIWQNLPTGEAIEPTSLNQAYTEELQNITRGGDVDEIDKFLRQKLGEKFNGKGELVGGKLFKGRAGQKATPKELHQLYSVLGRRVRKLAEEAGNSNKIRILNKTRRAILEDLESANVGEEYKQAINFSRQLNEKFTSGELGRVLGFQRGLATSEDETLETLLRSGGEAAKRNVNQLLEASPHSKEDIKNFLRSRFMMETTNESTKRISKESGQKFIRTHRRLLDALPDLKQELSKAVSKQKRVDTLKGADEVEEISPIAKQKSAASLFLNREDPNEAVRKILGKDAPAARRKTQSFTELNRLAKKDPTGKAKKGLKNSVISELLEKSKIQGDKGISDVTGRRFVSGKNFLESLDELSEPLKQSGLMSEKEINRLRRIGNALKKVETQRTQGEAGQITTDVPGQALELLGQYVGAHMSRLAPGGGGAGVGLQEAQMASSLGRRLLVNLTHDEARNLLIRATRDDELMKDLLKNANKMRAEKQKAWLRRITDKAKEMGGRGFQRAQQAQAPATGVAPATVSAGRASQERAKEQELNRRLQNLSPGQ